ncbi:YwbE family protein [Dyadobacter arcticus]|uniref:Repeat protein (TIGR03833 family) n=1 Tax=Dyadobacter arcticus TaxID=1078754 RepID=A0ABX0UN56_9BACT|nr:YwbE family protein [Dyadobacter arcticus]NIJ53125.1 putative repeat protein (TIGR03833 family) [Dyadobacter arcticus]
MSSLPGTERKNITPGLSVSVVLKKDQRSGALTDGIVRDILTKSPNHTHGIKVRLETGEVGRVKVIKEPISN